MPRASSPKSAASCPAARPAGDSDRPPTDNRLSQLREENIAPHRGAELRKSKRYQASALVMIEENRLGILGYARMQNFSAGGLMLDSDFALNPGQLIKLRFDKPLHFLASKVVSSRVVWCRDLDAAGDAHSRFAAGVSLT
jgi:hypothetical protein